MAATASNDLNIAISALGLITRRAPHLERILASQGQGTASSDPGPAETQPEDAQELAPEAEIDGTEDDGDMEGELGPDPRTLRNKVLDRLAEVLAGYKTDPRSKEADATLDARHVSSTMMHVDERFGRVKIFCSKNEGLDQQGELGDTQFLGRWKVCMEDFAKKGD